MRPGPAPRAPAFRPAGLASILILLGLAAALGACGDGDDAEPVAPGSFGFAASADPGEPRQRRVRPGPQRGQPNIVVLMTDDLDLDSFERTLPATRAAFAEGGTEFTNAFVSTPLCCPSRASFLSGRYGHNNGILENNPGYPLLRGKRKVLPVRLSRAGYRTAMVGKFMNGWERTPAGARGEAAPGWDEWVEMRRTYGYYDYELNLGGEKRRYGRDRKDYLTDVLTEQAVEVIERSAGGGEPLFLWMSWWAPHPELSGATNGECRGSAIPADVTTGEFAGESLPGGAAIDEPEISDKPAFLRERRQLRPDDRRGARTSFRCRLASMEAVDRGVGEIVKALERRGVLDETAFIFTSDNGFFHLEHRLPDGKGLPYDEASRVPLLIDLPRPLGTQVGETGAMASSIDLAPTILNIAGLDPCPTGTPCMSFDGISLTGALGRRAERKAVDRPLLIESSDGRPCAYSALRTRAVLYVEHERDPAEPLCPAGERELYDLASDPDQLENLLGGELTGPERKRLARAEAALDRLRDCAGTANGAPSRRPGLCG